MITGECADRHLHDRNHASFRVPALPPSPPPSDPSPTACSMLNPKRCRTLLRDLATSLACAAWLLPLILNSPLALTAAHAAEWKSISIEPALLHLRSGSDVEWSTFPQTSDGRRLKIRFEADANDSPWTLTLRQVDVKEYWNVLLNEKRIGQLVRDENDLEADFEVPASVLRDGENVLEIVCKTDTPSDDIRVGQIQLHPQERVVLRTAADLQVVVVDTDNQPIPARITVVNPDGTLVPVETSPDATLAMREGVVYTATGEARFGVRPGTYRLYAGRGFEYSVASANVTLREGERAKRTLMIERQVDTEGWVACDTHVHTVTHSGHGDCSIEERMVTLAAEGIELPIATDHNKQIDYRPTMAAVGVETEFTPVIGNEVTTKHGHFNVFPAAKDAQTPDHTELDWLALFQDIYSTPNVRVAILNHARDLHSDFRPFSPRHHISLSGQNLEGWEQSFNAMELINSGATQTNIEELFIDWCGLINHGLPVTPVGSSDSHDVSRYIVGQGRTYIAGDDRDPANINVEAAVDSFLKGKVIVSYGLLLKLTVQAAAESRTLDGKAAGPGEMLQLPSDADAVSIQAEVLGPHWTRGRTLQLFVNGKPLPEKNIGDQNRRRQPLKAKTSWTIPRAELRHDCWISAVAIGDGIDQPFWPIAKPYQPDSTEFTPLTFSSTGPIRIDVDGDGQYSSPRQYAKQLLTSHQSNLDATPPDLHSLAESLREYDRSVVTQTMSLLLESGIEPPQAMAGGMDARGNAFLRQWQASVRARLEQQE